MSASTWCRFRLSALVFVPPPSFDPNEFVELARRLIASANPSQAELRTSVSRAYYAVHLRAREQLVSAGKIVRTRTGEEHRLVIEALRSAGRSEGDQIDSLRIQRRRADYEINQTISLTDARLAVALATAIYASL